MLQESSSFSSMLLQGRNEQSFGVQHVAAFRPTVCALAFAQQIP